MFQIRIHGRGGQGVVSAAEMLSVAAFLEGMHAQAFPSFGSERMGAPVMAFCRLDDKEIRLREPVTHPDALIIQDPTLLNQVDLFAGLDTRGYLLINTRRKYSDLGLGDYVKRFPTPHLHRAGHRAGAQARRPAGAQRRAARQLRRDHPTRAPGFRAGGDPRQVPRRDRREQCCRRDRGLRLDPQQLRKEHRSCFTRSRDPEPWPKPLQCAVPR